MDRGGETFQARDCAGHPEWILQAGGHGCRARQGGQIRAFQLRHGWPRHPGGSPMLAGGWLRPQEGPARGDGVTVLGRSVAELDTRDVVLGNSRGAV